MIYGLGVDCVKVERMAKSMEKQHFVGRVFSAEERAFLEGLSENKRRESAAACFAAKEAFLKAAGRGLGGFALPDIGALRRPGGQPYYQLAGTAKEFCNENGLTPFLTMAHEDGMAVAVAVLERG